MYTDKGLGPAIMEITRYNQRAHSDHFDNPINYRGLDETEAILINETICGWICERFIDYPEPDTASQNERTIFKQSLCGVQGTKDGVVAMNISLQLPYFYLLPKVHKTPCATRPVVSGVSSVLEPPSKWVDIQLFYNVWSTYARPT